MVRVSGLLVPFALAACLAGHGDTPRFPEPPPAPVEGGAFAQMVRAADFVEAGVVVLDPTGRPDKPEFRLPADFEPATAVVLSGDRLVADFPEMFARLAAAIAPRARLVATVAEEAAARPVREALRAAGVPRNRASLLQAPTDTIWVRDFGGVFIENREGERLALDFDYRRRSGSEDRGRDDDAAGRIARGLKTPVERVAMTLEGGHLLSNGSGLLLVTTAAINANIARGYTAEQVNGYFARAFGCRTIAVVEPLRREPTGHIDVFACFTDAQTVVIGEYAADVDPVNAAVLDRNAKLLRSVHTGDDPLRVVRVPMPRNDDDRWRTYTNVLFVKPALLVPSYQGADPAQEAAALATFRRLLPEWQVETVDATDLIARDGALRCVTLTP